MNKYDWGSRQYEQQLSRNIQMICNQCNFMVVVIGY